MAFATSFQFQRSPTRTSLSVRLVGFFILSFFAWRILEDYGVIKYFYGPDREFAFQMLSAAAFAVVMFLTWPLIPICAAAYWLTKFFKAQLLVTFKWAVLPLLCGYGLYRLYRRYSPRAQEASEANARGEGNDKNQSQQGQSQQQSRTNNSHSYSDQNSSNGNSQSRQQQSTHQHSSNYSSGRSQTNSRAQANSASAKSPWEILGVRQGASYDEIKKAFRHAIRQYHPDRVNDLGKEFQDLAHQKAIEIQQAYERLTKYH